MTDQPDEHAPLEHEPAGADVQPDVEPDVEPDFEPELDAHLGEELFDDAAPARTPVSTGHPAVDEVLRSLEGLDGRPVDEHVAAFEQAHEVLRRALSDAGDDAVARPGD